MTYGAIQMPVYPLKMAMCVAAALLLIQGIAEVLKIILDVDTTSEEASMNPELIASSCSACWCWACSWVIRWPSFWAVLRF